MSTETDTLRAEIEAAAVRLGMSPRTLGERAGQGGKFYDRLCDGKRVWPETVAKVRQRLVEFERQRDGDAA